MALGDSDLEYFGDSLIRAEGNVRVSQHERHQLAVTACPVLTRGDAGVLDLSPC